MRTPAAKIKQRTDKFFSFPAPVGGWIANVNLATPGARRPDGTKVNGAAKLENWFPTATAIEMRGGSERYAVIYVGDDHAHSVRHSVKTLFSYINGNNRKLFAAHEHALFDITTIVSADDLFTINDDGKFFVDKDGNFIVESGSPTPIYDSLTGGDWSVVQFATSGGVFLRAVNGVDTPLVYDGSSWGTSPAITGATATTLSYVWAFKNRLFFIQKDTLDAWYLPVDSIGGAATKIPLGGVFGLGGSLLFGATWSLDTGSGLSEQCVFVTTEGEVAVYQGSDPSSANTWSKVGVYRLGRPRGPKAFIHAGGDLVIATDIGFVPLSQAIQRDISVISPSAVSYPIEDAWNSVVAERSDVNWQCEVWPTKQMVLIGFPTTYGNDEFVFIANARTGAWAKYTGWGATCFEVFGERMFFGTADGRIIEAEVTGLDQSSTYTSICVPLFETMKTPATLKTGMQARAVLRAPGAVEAKLSLQKDYTINLPPAPDDISVTGTNTWGSGIWGTSIWDVGSEKQTFQDWRSINGSGNAISVATQVTSGALSPPNVELVQIDLMYEQGDAGS